MFLCQFRAQKVGHIAISCQKRQGKIKNILHSDPDPE